MTRFILNIVGFQVGWTASILAARHDVWWAALIIVALVAFANLAFDRDRLTTVRVAMVVALIGAPVDALLVAFGLLTFEPGFAPFLLWVFALWLNFALTLGVSMRWLHGRWALCVVLGAIGGPMTYFGGLKLGAIGMHEQVALSIAALAVSWGVLLPVVVFVAGRIRDARAIEADGDRAGRARDEDRA